MSSGTMESREAELRTQDAVSETQDSGPSASVPKRSDAVRVPPIYRPLLPTLMPGIGKGAIVATPEQETPAEDSLPRDSWISLESRSSVVPSVFSRLSTLTSSTRQSYRQSSIESPISAMSPLSPEQRKDSFGYDRRYCCTFCEASFANKDEWMLHEWESHDRPEVLSCDECQTVFTRAVLLEDHRKSEHGVEPGTYLPRQVKRVPIRSSWGCGFCAVPTVFSSRSEYLDHIGKHYDDGRERSEWEHSLVIMALLSQPKVKAAWDVLVKEEELACGAKLRFTWDSTSIEPLPDIEDGLSLQDILEFFATGSRSPREVAERAMAMAHPEARADVGVSGLHTKDFRRQSEELQPLSSLASFSKKSPALQDSTQEEEEDDEITPPAETPSVLVSQPSFSVQPQTVSPNPSSSQQFSAERSSHQTSFALHASSKGTGAGLSSSKILVKLGDNATRSSSVPPGLLRGGQQFDSSSSFQHQMKQAGLRRTDSDRNLALFNQIRGRDGNHIGRPQSQLSIRSRHVPAIPGEELSGGNRGKLLMAPEAGLHSAVRPHTSSSTLSSRDRDGSRSLDDSSSEVISDDSLSDTDSWLEFDGKPVATRAWKVAFQGKVQGGMELLWARYNSEFDAMIRQCAGERSSGSPQFRDSSGRIRKGTTTSRHGLSKNLRPNGRYPEEDDEDDDEGEGNRPASSLSKRSSVSAKQFACPFRKHDPQKYSLQTHEVCAIRSWPTISRLKEHLYRRHYKIHCPRCKTTFNDARELADHEMYLQGCEVTNAPTPGDIDAWKERQLKSRRHNARRKTDEEKWREIYELLFPNEEIPSPYPEVAEDLVSVPSETHSSLSFQHFLLTQMPRLFTQTAEEQAGSYIQVHGSLPMESIPEIIDSSLRKAFQAWEARGNELGVRDASIASMSFLPTTSPSVPFIFAPSTTAPATTAYQTPPMSASIEQHFLLGNMAHSHMPPFTPDITQGHDMDSGFIDEPSFSGFSMAPENYSGFVPHYDREQWDNGLGLMNNTTNNMTYDDTLDLNNQFRFHRG